MKPLVLKSRTNGSRLVLNPAHIVSMQDGYSPGNQADGTVITAAAPHHGVSAEYHVEESLDLILNELRRLA